MIYDKYRGKNTRPQCVNALSSAGVLLEIYGLKFALKQYCCLLMANQRNAAG
jgi:hypothetical protein